MERVKLLLVDINDVELEDLMSSALLTENNIKDIEKISLPETKKEKIASSHLKNKYIGEYHLNERGKPLANNCHFNISHSHGLVGIAINEKYEIGLDIEKVRDMDDLFKRYTMTEEEYSYAKDNEKFFELWTSKESLIKCRGTGIDKQMKDIPSLPIEGKKEYQEKKYYTRVLKIDDYVICITLENKDFEIDKGFLYLN